MYRALGLVLLVACGGGAQPAPPPVAATPARATCSDVGVLLRGGVGGDPDVSGPRKEALIAKGCVDDRWSQAVIDCVASTPSARAEACLDQLDVKQRTAWDARMQHFREQHGDPDLPFASEGEHDHDHDLVAASAPDPHVECTHAAADPSSFPPALGDKSDEREWTENVRRGWLLEECDHGWSETLKRCLRGSAGNAGKTEACVAAHLPAGERAELTKKLTELDRLASKIAAAKQKPATIGCKQVVARHYGDARWKAKLDGYKPAERKKMIAASRAKMLADCKDQGWADTLRACIVAGGDEPCFASYGMRLRWGFPAAGVVTTIGVAECDAYRAAVMKIATCDKLPQQSRDALVRSFDEMQAQMASLPAADRAKSATSCAAGIDAIAQIAKSVGC